MDRIDDIADLLLGAAFADEHLHDREKAKIRSLLTTLLSGDLPEGLSRRVDLFDPADFDAVACARGFVDASEDDKKRVVELIAAVHDADEELDLAEDDYLRSVAEAMDLAETALGALVLDYEVEDLKDSLGKVRAVPPPVPKS